MDPTPRSSSDNGSKLKRVVFIAALVIGAILLGYLLFWNHEVHEKAGSEHEILSD